METQNCQDSAHCLLVRASHHHAAWDHIRPQLSVHEQREPVFWRHADVAVGGTSDNSVLPPPPSASLFSFSFSFSYHLLTTVHVRYIDLTSSHRIIKVDNDEQCFTGSLHRLTIALSAGFGLTYVTTLSPSTLVSPLTTSFVCKREGWCSSHHYDSSL